jgi:hypothetical protein
MPFYVVITFPASEEESPAFERIDISGEKDLLASAKEVTKRICNNSSECANVRDISSQVTYHPYAKPGNVGFFASANNASEGINAKFAELTGLLVRGAVVVVEHLRCNLCCQHVVQNDCPIPTTFSMYPLLRLSYAKTIAEVLPNGAKCAHCVSDPTWAVYSTNKIQVACREVVVEGVPVYIWVICNAGESGAKLGVNKFWESIRGKQEPPVHNSVYLIASTKDRYPMFPDIVNINHDMILKLSGEET